MVTWTDVKACVVPWLMDSVPVPSSHRGLLVCESTLNKETLFITLHSGLPWGYFILSCNNIHGHLLAHLITALFQTTHLSWKVWLQTRPTQKLALLLIHSDTVHALHSQRSYSWDERVQPSGLGVWSFQPCVYLNRDQWREPLGWGGN